MDITLARILTVLNKSFVTTAGRCLFLNCCQLQIQKRTRGQTLLIAQKVL